MFFTHLEPKTNDLQISDEGQVEWFDMHSLENIKIVPSDKWMIETFLIKNKKGNHSVIMDEKDEELLSIHTEEH